MQVEATITHLVNLHRWASFAYLSLDLYFHHVALEGMGHICELVKEKHKSTQFLVKLQNDGHILFQDMQKPSQDARLPWPWRKTEPGVLGCVHQGTAHPDLRLRDFLERHCLDEEEKRIRKMGEHLTNLCGLGWVNISWEGSPSSKTRSFWSLAGFEGSLCTPLVSQLLPPAATRQCLPPWRPLSSCGPTENNKAFFFAAKKKKKRKKENIN